LQTKVVAVREAVKVLSVKVTAIPAVRLARDEVTLGVHEAGAIPLEMVIATVAKAVPSIL
jgi:hypothetical protein